jgi:hypothetical protein
VGNKEKRNTYLPIFYSSFFESHNQRLYLVSLEAQPASLLFTLISYLFYDASNEKENKSGSLSLHLLVFARDMSALFKYFVVLL